jgi:hypothetical protein
MGLEREDREPLEVPPLSFIRCYTFLTGLYFLIPTVLTDTGLTDTGLTDTGRSQSRHAL